MLLDEPLRAFTFICALVRYAKLARELLAICHEHMSDRKTTVEATQSLVQAVVRALPPAEREEEEEQKAVENTKKHPVVAAEREMKDAAKVEAKAGASPDKAVSRATDPAGIMRRAVGRDMGDGNAVLETMKKFSDDVRIQSHGVRALKGVLRGGTATSSEPEKTASNSFPSMIATSEEEEDEDDEDGRHRDNQKTEANARRVIQTVIDKMKQFPDSLALQRDGLLCLAEYTNQADEHVAIITSSGGISSIMDAMVALPDDVPANMAGLSVLAHPKIAGKRNRVTGHCDVEC